MPSRCLTGPTSPLRSRARPRRRWSAWDRIAERALRYRWRHEIGDEEPGLLGPEPDQTERKRVAEWRRTREGIEMDRRRLERAREGRVLHRSVDL